MTFYEYLKAFTETYRAHEQDDVSLREAYCVAVQSRYEFLPIKPGEPVAGRKRVLPRGLFERAAARPQRKLVCRRGKGDARA